MGDYRATLATSSRPYRGQADPPAPEDIIAGTLACARDQAGYHLVADMQQTLIPQALPANRGT